MSQYVSIDLLAAASDVNYYTNIPQINITEPAISLLAYSDEFEKLLGPHAKAKKIADLDWQAFHEAGIYNKKDNSLYVAGNYIDNTDNVNITVVSLDDYSVSSIQFANVWEANGGASYYPPGSNTKDTPPRQIWCDQGDSKGHESGLVSVNPNTNKSEVVVNNYQGRTFASLNDVKQHPETGDLWFTDGFYGYYNGLRPEPTIPKQVYRFDPSTGEIQVVADGFVELNGCEFSADLKTFYATDTGLYDTEEHPTHPSTIYAYDVSKDGKTLGPKRTFAYLDQGIPDGIHTDTDGNVWSAGGNGVHVHNKHGVLIGKIYLGEDSNNFAFAPGKVFIFSNYRLWVVENIKAEGREVCREYGVCKD